MQPRSQGFLLKTLNDFQNGGYPGKGWVVWYNLGKFYHVTFWENQSKMTAKVEFEIYFRTQKCYVRGSNGF